MKKMKTISAALLAIIMTFAMSASAFGETLPGAEAAGQDADVYGPAAQAARLSIGHQRPGDLDAEGGMSLAASGAIPGV